MPRWYLLHYLPCIHKQAGTKPDFRPANILLRINDIDSLSEEELLKQIGFGRADQLLTISGEPPGPHGPD